MVLAKYTIAIGFVLKSCPLLEEFKLNGSITAPGALILNFGQHARLKYIESDMTDCTYYIFDHHPGVRWDSFERTIWKTTSCIRLFVVSIWLGWLKMMSKSNWLNAKYTPDYIHYTHHLEIILRALIPQNI